MNLELFIEASKGNQIALEKIYELIEESHQDPNFIMYLFESVYSPISKSNLKLKKQLIIEINNTIRSCWLKDENFWNYENKILIVNQIFELLFSSNPDERIHLVYSFEHIIFKTYPNCIWITQMVIDFFNSKSESLQDICNLLQIIYFWCKSCGEVGTIKEFNENIDNINHQLINYLISFTNSALPNLLNDQNAVIIIKLVCKCISYLSKLIVQSLISGEFDSLIQSFITAYLISNNNEEIIQMKIQICKFFIHLNGEFLSTKLLKESSKNIQRINYGKHYKLNIAPKICEIIFTTLSSISNYLHKKKNFYLIY